MAWIVYILISVFLEFPTNSLYVFVYSDRQKRRLPVDKAAITWNDEWSTEEANVRWNHFNWLDVSVENFV